MRPIELPTPLIPVRLAFPRTTLTGCTLKRTVSCICTSTSARARINLYCSVSLKRHWVLSFHCTCPCKARLSSMIACHRRFFRPGCNDTTFEKLDLYTLLVDDRPLDVCDMSSRSPATILVIALFRMTHSSKGVEYQKDAARIFSCCFRPALIFKFLRPHRLPLRRTCSPPPNVHRRFSSVRTPGNPSAMPTRRFCRRLPFPARRASA